MVLGLVLAIGIGRLFFLTVVMGDYYRSVAKKNITKIVTQEEKRGVILDRNNKQLALNIENEGRTVRYYPFGEVMSGVIGYLGKEDGENWVGKMGLEKTYQEKLTKDNLVTNLDVELQKTAFVAIKEKLKETGKSGAVVISKINGEILSLVSAPSFDNNLFVEGGKRSDFGGDYKDINSLLKDNEKKPLFNRAISGDFAPGSVYKILPALAALETGKINRGTMVMDTGEIKVGDYRFGNWYLDKYGRTEGNIDVVTALSRSNDIFFYKTGEALGADLLIEWSKRFGLGSLTGIDLYGEADGFVPSPLWREKTLGERWFLGNTYHLAIGQGDLMTTPLQINRMTAMAISGKKCEPRIVGVGKCENVNTNEENRKIVLEGMRGACSPGGTAYPLFKYAGKIYCKTGTAQKGGKETVSNAWMTVVIPKGNNIDDWIVMTILIEEGGEGSAVAGTVAVEIVGSIVDDL